MNYKQFNDNELLSMLRINDKNAFDEIFHRYWSDLYNAAYNIFRDRETCMDVVQELYIWLWEHRGKLEVKNLKPYLIVAVKFKIANYIRNGKVKDAFFDRLKQIKQPAELADDSLEVKELMAIIDKCTLQLPEKCREIFILSRREYLSNKEIAQRLGISVKTVENQMTIAIRKLRASMSKVAVLLFLFISQ